MIAQDVMSHETFTFDDLKPLATATGPCLTLTVPLPNPSEIDVRLKNAMRGAQKKLAEYGVDARNSASLMAPVQEFAATAATDRTWGRAVVVFRSPDLFRYYALRGPVQEAQTVEEHFQVRPLLAALAHEMRFHLLCLSRRHVRLFHCTQLRAEQAAMPDTLPQNLDTWLHTQKPDDVPKDWSSAGTKFGTSADRDREREYVTHFLAAVEKAVTTHLHNDPAPLVLAGVEYEIAIYRHLSRYRQTLFQPVVGSPDGVSDQELYEKAMQVVLQSPSEPLRKALADFGNHAGTGRVTTDAPTAIQAARLGRVMDFLIAENAETWGIWNAETPDAATGTREELLNAAALQTLRHGGRAFVVKASDMPESAGVAAVLRF